MKSIAALGAVALFCAACNGEQKFRSADDQALCSIRGEAFVVGKGAIDTSFVTRTPSADALCARMKAAP